MARIGPFAVVCDPASVVAYARATGYEGEGAPAAWPTVWLTTGELGAALRALVPPGKALVHESQSFVYAAPLTVGACYKIAATVAQETGPDRLVVEADATAPEGGQTLAMRAVLRIVAPQ
ncbi:MAG: hypothetical protein KGL46_01455 [Hyphomicrobiales bacterium]|nr:hypothetical protein [Hyphomicrobiales bacterium]